MASALSIAVAVVVLGIVIFFIARKSARPPSAIERERSTPTAKLDQGTPGARKAPGATREASPDDQATAPQETRPADSPAQAVQAGAVASADATKDSREQDVAAIRQGLATTRGGFVARLAKLFGTKREIDKGVLEEIEEVLISADLGVRTTERILEDLRGRMQSGELRDEQSVWNSLRSQAEAILHVEAGPLNLQSSPSVMLMTGVNGVGKTTTIGKLASRYTAQGKKVLLAAGDTYRAAAVLQLEMWGKRVGCPVVKGKENADPGSVIFEAIKRAKDERFDLVIADTAGRLHTKAPLMEELKKIERTVLKATDGRTPDEVFLVLDATTGQNAVQQMKMFRDALNITGVVLTKLDGTAKGGVVLGIVDQHKVPIRFIGLGERVEDLREFEPGTFVEALFAKPAEAILAA
jgi:fused signal recognition particle receptor